MTAPSPWSRRAFLRAGAASVAHVGLSSLPGPLGARPLRGAQEAFPVVAEEPWGRLHRVAEGVWALISTPLQDRTTLCNGGIIAGRAGVLLVEAFGSDAGAGWMASMAEELAGRPPTHVVLTHYHGDHTSGLRGAVEPGDAELLVTPVTRTLLQERGEGAPGALLRGARLLDTRRPTEIELGGRSVVVVPRRGHTASDVSVEVQEPSVVFCGDLVWNGMFPNYRDAAPRRLGMAVRLLRARRPRVWIPGHGGLADEEAMDRYLALLDHVEQVARQALEDGVDAAEAAEASPLPERLGPWRLFGPRYVETAIRAWMDLLASA